MNLEQTHDGGDIVVLLPCTESKGEEGDIAIQLYFPTGAIASVKGALQDNQYDPNVDTFFLSARHGIIKLDDYLEPYEEELTKDRTPRLINELGEFLSDSEYAILYSFMDKLYAHVVDEVAFRQSSRWDIDTIMLKPCGRGARRDGAKVVKHIVRKDTDIDPASDVSW